MVGSEPSDCSPVCGDGTVTDIELCDDIGALGAPLTPVNGDGCSDICTIEPEYTCTGTPSRCTPICGDGLLKDNVHFEAECTGGDDLKCDEECDDGNTVDLDGCDSDCKVEVGWVCTSVDNSVCSSVCGDGFMRDAEECDDGNEEDWDGCYANCEVELGYSCVHNDPSICTAGCGDGIMKKGEVCDDGNTSDGDGCTKDCGRVEFGWTCTSIFD